jgi:hypothetical protein
MCIFEKGYPRKKRRKKTRIRRFIAGFPQEKARLG